MGGGIARISYPNTGFSMSSTTMTSAGVKSSSFEPNLAARVDQALQTNPYVNGRLLRFETEGSRVVLKGNVKSYFQKQMAQEVIRKVAGVEEIENCLEVLM
jgi:osmotically-inducible protein OsmY